MAIVKMKKLTLLATLADKDNIYDALVKTNAVQLKRSTELADCTTINCSVGLEAQLVKISRVENAISYLVEMAENYNAANKKNKVVLPKNSFARPKTEIDFDFFVGFGQNVERLDESVNSVFNLRDQLNSLTNALAQNLAEQEKYSLIADLPHPTTWYKDTESSVVQLCQMPLSEWENAQKLASQYDLVDIDKVCQNKVSAIVAVVAHRTQTEFFEKAAALGMVKCSLTCDVVPKLIIGDLQAEQQKLQEQIAKTQEEIASYCTYVAEWKIYSDYLNLCAQKAQADGELQVTASTFVLEGFCPAESEQKVQQAIESISDCLVLHFDEVAEDEPAPVLTKNNGVVKQFEMVTNMYTPPDYHEVDPNPVMSVFYFLLFGFMVADMGYGLTLILAGLFARFAIKQKTGLKTLLQLFGICGIAAVGVGALFGSFFSYTLYPGVIPDPAKYPMVMMIISLMVGIIHLCAGIGCNMAVKIKHKQALSAWLADFPWIIVFLSLIVAIFNMALDMAAYEPYEKLRLPPMATNIALYICLGALAIAVIFAGVGAKGFGKKVIKSFGSVYGILNYFTDVMSYIRVFGLMLSSALIGVVVNDLGKMVMGGGGIGYALGGLVLVFAHLFNLVMGCLSVYIHNGRLQYVEFFGKFYTGDGTLFVPFGSDTKYTLLTDTPFQAKTKQ